MSVSRKDVGVSEALVLNDQLMTYRFPTSSYDIWDSNSQIKSNQ